MRRVQAVGPVSQGHLSEIATQRGSIRVGATSDPGTRARVYANEGYAGIMFVAKTSNMRKAENRLLKAAFESGSGRHNQQTRSNAVAEPGFVYVISGRRYQ